MQGGTEELRERVLEGDAVLRKAGTSFVNGLEQLQDLRRVESAVAASCLVCTTDQEYKPSRDLETEEKLLPSFHRILVEAQTCGMIAFSKMADA